MVEDAHLVGASFCSDIGHPESVAADPEKKKRNKHAHRDLLRKFLKGTECLTWCGLQHVNYTFFGQKYIKSLIYRSFGSFRDEVLVGTYGKRVCFGPSPGPPKAQIAALDRFQPPNGSDKDSLKAPKKG